MTKVINIKHNPNWKQEGIIYIGRGSMFGNPYKIGEDGDRNDVIEKYIKHFHTKLWNHPKFETAIMGLTGLTLGCYCRPKAGFQGKVLCHGQIIAAYLDGIKPEEVE
jgi:hypothetical protein